MSSQPIPPQSDPTSHVPAASPPAAQHSGRDRVKFILKAIEVRMRFIVVLVGLGLVIAYWSTIQNYWDHWTRPFTAAAEDSDTEYYCPMHPSVVRPGLDPGGKIPHCPICGMPLSKRHKGEQAALPAGVLARVQLSPDRVTMAGVQIETVGYRPLAGEIRTVGYVDYDESKLSKIVARVKGFIKKLYIDTTFIPVEEGQPLADLYSPELFSSVQELLIAKKYNDKAMLASGRQRLELLGIDDKEIDALLEQNEARPHILIRSPQSGHIIEKNVVTGSAVEPGMTLFQVAELTSVWIEAEVYEKDLSLLRPGQKVEATVDALPGEAFLGQVALVHPHLETATRTNRVRLVLENPEHKLRPGMFATVNIHTPLAEIEPFNQSSASDGGVLAVPESAVIDTGTKKIVYIERKPGVFEGVEVKLGPRSGDYDSVIEGLAAGDRVAAAGAFLIDAETRLNPGAAGAYFGASGATTPSSATTAPAAANDAAPAAPTAKQLANLEKLSPEDRAAAMKQAVCPISGDRLGEMGVPLKIDLDGHTVFLCCEGCKDEAVAKKDEVLKKLGLDKP